MITRIIKKARAEHLPSLLRGIAWQLLHLRFGFVLLLGKGSSIKVPRKIELYGFINLGRFAILDLRNCASGSLGPNVSFGPFSVVRASGSKEYPCPNFSIGKDASFGPYCNIGGGMGLSIGDQLLAGPYVSIHPEDHNFFIDTPIRTQGISGAGIKIGDDCWLGSKVTILDGVNIANGTALGALSVVTRSIHKEQSVYAGVPAKLLKVRPTRSNS